MRDLLSELYLLFLHPLLYISPALLPLVLPSILPIFLLRSPFSPRYICPVLSSLCHRDLCLHTACGRLLLRDLLLALLLVFGSSGLHILEHLRLHQCDQILLEAVAVLGFHLFMCAYDPQPYHSGQLPLGVGSSDYDIKLMLLVGTDLLLVVSLLLPLRLLVLILLLEYYNNDDDARLTSLDDDADGPPLLGTRIHEVELLEKNLVVY